MPLYLTSELTNRDWHARLLMADYATAAGHSVVVGQQWAVLENLDRLPRGAILFKTMNGIQGNGMYAAAKCGHVVAAMDEEAMPLAVDKPDVRAFLAKGYSERAREYCSVFFANSERHAEAVRPLLGSKIVLTGNARVDLLTPQGCKAWEDEAAKLRAEYGDFVLYNSNTASINSLWSEKEFFDIQVRAGALDPDDPKSCHDFVQMIEYEKRNREAFVDDILNNLTHRNVVVRPHPSEAQRYWQEFGVTTVYNTHHRPWMLAACEVVHTRCTTGIEAALMDKSVRDIGVKTGYWGGLYFPQDQAREYLPEGGAQKMAAELCKLDGSGGGPNSGRITARAFDGVYKPLMPGEKLLRKFRKTAQQANQDWVQTRRASGLSHKVVLIQVDESLFLLNPA